MDKAKVRKYFENYQRIVKFDRDKYFLAICEVQLGNYSEGQRLFQQSCAGMFQTKWWLKTSQPNFLVDICILAGQTDAYPAILSELELYKQDNRGNSLVALYSYATMELLTSPHKNIEGWIQGLLKYPKYKDIFAMGQVFEAIVAQDQAAFEVAMANLLKAHEGMAKRGSLRETATGLLCMPAMSLAYVALQYDLKVEITNDYFSQGYLEYLTGR